jgi:hypothetical protein
MKMSWCRSVLAALVCAVLSACAATTALESQNKPLTARTARIYILRPGGWAGGAMSANVKIDGVNVGSVAIKSYLFVDRPPGRHKIDMSISGEFGTNVHEIEVVAGRTYYMVVNVRTTAAGLRGGGVLVMRGSDVGRPVGQSSSVFGYSYLSELDPTAGAAMISRLKAP